MIKSIELFSGTGGLALGLQEAGFGHVALVERDNHSCDNLRRNISGGRCRLVTDWNVLQTDIKNVDFAPYEGKVQLVSGGPPCQPFSIGGKSRAYEDSRDMFPEAVRAVREIKPKAFVFENVKGLLRKSFASYFNYILLQLSYPEVVAGEGMAWQEHLSLLEKLHTSASKQTLRYNVSFRLLNAADYGVPQKRQRVVIVGFRDDIDAGWSFPDSTHSCEALICAQWIDGEYWDEQEMPRPRECPFSQTQLAAARKAHEGFSAKKRWRTVRDAFKGLPSPCDNDLLGDEHIPNHQFCGWARSYAGHSGSSLDSPSKTIKAGAHGVPGGENMLVQDDGRTRYFTVREAARLQTFPDEFTFSSSWTESMRQIGNAVPVELAHVIGRSVAKHIS